MSPGNGTVPERIPSAWRTSDFLSPLYPHTAMDHADLKK